MSMNSTTWGDSVAAAVKALGITAGTAITDNQLKVVWETICGVHRTHISSNAVVSVTGIQAGSSTTSGTVS